MCIYHLVDEWYIRVPSAFGVLEKYFSASCTSEFPVYSKNLVKNSCSVSNLSCEEC